MTRLRLTLAMSDYDHVRDFTRGPVRAEGIDINYLDLSIEETFYRFTKHREWDVSEMSFGKYVSLLSQGDDSMTAIPVFPSRIFRQSSLYVRADGGMRTPHDLAGKRIGLPEWAQTAAIYTRGWLAHQVGLDLAAVEWVQAGVNEPGRVEKVSLKLPDGVRVTPALDRSLTDMLLAGDLDAVMSAHPPEPFEEGDGRIVRLFGDYRQVEEDYYRETGIFPIMHMIALRRDVFAAHRWIAMNLLKAFEEAKARSVARVLEITAPRVPIPWCFGYAEQARALFGDDFWPYGVEANRTTLDAFLQYAYEQGVCHRRLAAEELFPAEVQSRFRV